MLSSNVQLSIMQIRIQFPFHNIRCGENCGYFAMFEVMNCLWRYKVQTAAAVKYFHSQLHIGNTFST